MSSFWPKLYLRFRLRRSAISISPPAALFVSACQKDDDLVGAIAIINVVAGAVVHLQIGNAFPNGPDVTRVSCHESFDACLDPGSGSDVSKIANPRNEDVCCAYFKQREV